MHTPHELQNFESFGPIIKRLLEKHMSLHLQLLGNFLQKSNNSSGNPPTPNYYILSQLEIFQ